MKGSRFPIVHSPLGMTVSEVATFLGVSRTTFWKLRRERLDFPRPVCPLHPGGIALWDRSTVIRWWKAQARAAQTRTIEMERAS